MNAPHGAVTLPRFSRRAESLGTENAFVVLAEVNALLRQGKDIVSFCMRRRVHVTRRACAWPQSGDRFEPGGPAAGLCA